MPIQTHIRRLFYVSMAWILFWVAGLPDYYQQYPAVAMALFDLALLGPVCWIIHKSLRGAPRGRERANALWWAFYVSVPLFIYDAAYCGLYLGHGWGFLVQYGYITVYYILPWVIFPILGRMAEARSIS